MADIVTIGEAFLADLSDAEAHVTQQVIQGYALIVDQLRGDLMTTVADIQSRYQAGEPVPPSLIYRDERLRALIQQAEDAVNALSQQLESSLTMQQATAAQLGQDAASQMIRESLSDGPVSAGFNTLPQDAINQLIGTLSDGSPLSDLLAQLGPDAAKAVREALITGLAAGESPAAVARRMRDALGGSMTRALTIARTEILRAYREASRQTYQQNSDVLDGWIWHAELDTDTCAFCIAMHGSLHPVDEVMGTHPRCRCAPVPLTKSWADLGFPGIPDNRPEIESGADWFDRQPESVQLSILGPAKFAAFQDGAITLDDLIGQRDDAQWGPVGWERSLKDILGQQEAQEWRMAAD